MRQYIVIFMMVCAIILSACSNDDANSTQQTSNNDAADVEQEAGSKEQVQMSEESDTQSSKSEPSTDEAQDTNSDRMVIYTGRLSIEVPNYDDAHNQLTNKIESLNGYVVESSTRNQDEDHRSGHIRARIPQESFQDFMNQIDSENIHIVEKSTQGEDVTEQYVDLESRLNSKEAVEQRLLNFLEESDDTESLLEISNDLASVQEEIEQLKGQMEYLENHSAHATVTIEIEEKRVNIPNIESEESLNTFERTQQVFMSTINTLIQLGSYLVVFIAGTSPILIPLLIIGGVIWYKRRKKKQSG
ncbi:DUF4349 domain-containing protein [Alkalibacillus salilacus]|uniref:Major membrane immunogen (Membrane-anchored lipoprotein) n=1 Tax=Alkalibacillus salilacus TaxID=284582 RepID=A0ABT9VFX5_9BACI|nr:DUF4349 domain-containing protein [Alkalibacillus salilacus]MDQ0159877.1 major membrane immunogen (membrane-anchored lipoprotein) [Alkalibacillus salilacus]